MSNSDSRIYGKVAPQFRSGEVAGTKLLTGGTYIGVVKNVNDPERIGRLMVWIPDLGGLENDDKNWQVVRYASPFMGSTDTVSDNAGKKSLEERFSAISQTYGMWMVPPDIGNQVLCTFVNGDPNRGFWFACVFDRAGHWGIPANGGGESGVDFNVDDIDKSQTQLRSIAKSAVRKGPLYLPLTEFNRYRDTNQDAAERKKVVHPILAAQIFAQGLHGDPVRGARKTSSQRDMPSGVFGISTPGLPLGRKGNPPKVITPGKSIFNREGGHTLVMDDGDYEGNGAHFKIRSSSGHQILLDDDSGIIYITNNNGSAYVELAASGQISLYSDAGMSIRTRGDFNLHSDGTLRLHGNQGVSIRSDGDFRMEGRNQFGITGGQSLKLFGDKELSLISEKGSINLFSERDLKLKAGGKAVIDATGSLGLQTGDAGSRPSLPKGITEYDQDDTSNRGGLWEITPKAVSTTVPIFPTHEPWPRTGFNTVSQSQFNIASTPAPNLDYTGGDARASRRKNVSIDPATGEVITIESPTATALGNDFLSKYPGVAKGLDFTLSSKNLPNAKSFNSQTAPRATNTVGTLSPTEVSSLMAGVAVLESSGDPNGNGDDYRVVNRFRYAGRYQMGAQSLESLGYMKPGSYSLYGQAAMDRGDVWTGKEGVDNLKSFLDKPAAQESAMQSLTSRNYKTLAGSGVIREDSPPEHVAGMLAVAHNLGAGAAVNWAKTGVGQDGNGTPGGKYYAAGRYAVANKVQYR